MLAKTDGERAMEKYFRYHERREWTCNTPRQPDEIDVSGKKYVVLYNVNGILAVYRVRPDRRLYHLKKYPRKIAEQYER